MLKYKYLLFDADNTLYDFNKSEAEAFRLTLIHFGFTHNSEISATYHKVNDLLWKSLERGEITQNFLRIERFRRLLEIMNADESLAEDMSREYIVNLGNMTYLIESSENVISKLNCEYKIYIITNGLYEVQSRRIAASPLKEYIDGIFISEQLGVSKPNREYFSKVCTAIGSEDVSDYLVIGDSLTSDIKGAVNYGIDSVWYNPRGNELSGVCPTYTIKNLDELLTLLL